MFCPELIYCILSVYIEIIIIWIPKIYFWIRQQVQVALANLSIGDGQNYRTWKFENSTLQNVFDLIVRRSAINLPFKCTENGPMAGVLQLYNKLGNEFFTAQENLLLDSLAPIISICMNFKRLNFRLFKTEQYIQKYDATISYHLQRNRKPEHHADTLLEDVRISDNFFE